MILGISMVAVCEGFTLAEKLGLDHDKLFDIASTASGQCWSLTNYCPCPGARPLVTGQPRFPAGVHGGHDVERPADWRRMRRGRSTQTTPLGAEAAALFGLFVGNGRRRDRFLGNH